MPDEIKVPARVLALAEQIGDQAIAWKEHDDGSIVIVFNSKGKQTFSKDSEEEFEEVLTVIHTKADAEAAVAKLTPTHTPKPKRKEK
jgi:hypothetical protein